MQAEKNKLKKEIILLEYCDTPATILAGGKKEEMLNSIKYGPLYRLMFLVRYSLLKSGVRVKINSETEWRLMKSRKGVNG